MLPLPLSHLPPPPDAARAVSAELDRLIRGEIQAAQGWISFERYMQLVLYAPGLGYYSGGSEKIGSAGDFATAPEISPLFARCVARQVAQLLERGLPDIVEVGAGSGILARDLLQALAASDCLPERYYIVEVSGDLRERQRTLLAESRWRARVHWLEELPSSMRCVLLTNEVLDAIPTHVVRKRDGHIEELGVAAADAEFVPSYRPATGALLESAESLGLEEGYQTEINLAARAFVRTFAERVDRGALLFFDYGFPAAEYYHAQRARGTLMCHYRHHAHDDAFVLRGLQDITAHVDFSAVARAAVEAGHHVVGYTTQAQFLVNCGITDLLAQTSAEDVRAYAPVAAQAQKLLSPAEMGELFKVLAIGRGIEAPLIGFVRGDRTHTL